MSVLLVVHFTAADSPRHGERRCELDRTALKLGRVRAESRLGDFASSWVIFIVIYCCIYVEWKI